MKNVLVIGFSTRNIVCSGTRAGYNMYSIDAFCDHDLIQCSVDARKLDIGDSFDASSISLEELAALIESFNVEFDAVIPGSGFESMGLDTLPYNVLANDPDIMRDVSDKYLFSKRMEKLNIAHPRTVLICDINELELPAMVKPACSGGGIFNMKVEDAADIGTIHERMGFIGIPSGKDRLIAQEYVHGIPASVSVISTKEKAFAIAVNEQLIGTSWLTSIPFAYCGNITPFETPYAEKIKRISEELILDLGLVGSNGVDFIISEKGPVLLEVNARFQGSLDTVEMATGINLLDAHIRAFDGQIDHLAGSEKLYACRAILYTDRKIIVTRDAQRKLLEKDVCDVPNAGQVINPGEPVISLICSGKNRDEVLSGIKESVIFIRESLNLVDS